LFTRFKKLFECLIQFSKQIFKLYKLNINKYPTLPSLAFAIFKKDYLKEREIGIIKDQINTEIGLGYTG
jgi:hypothetical protein